MADNFNVGDIVQLKSGGPKMTVNNVIGDTVFCAWFSGAKNNMASFNLNAITPATEEKPKK